MKKLIFAFLVLSVFIFPTFVLAKNDDASSTLKGESLKQELKERKSEKKEEFKERFDDKRKENIKNNWENMIKRLTSAIERLENLIVRVESRIEKMKGLGKEVESLETKLGETKLKLINAKTLLTDLSGDIDTLLNSNEPKVVFEQVKEDLKKIKETIVEVHRALVKIVGEMKEMKNE